MKALLTATVMVFGVSAFAAEPATTTTAAPVTAPAAKTAPAKMEGTKMAASDKPNFKKECKAEGKTSKKDLKACIKEKKEAAKASAPAAQ